MASGKFFCYDDASLQKDFFALTALSPLDGRYRSQLTEVAAAFSEYALIRQRVRVEVEYLLFLADKKLIPVLTPSQRRQIKALSDNFDTEQAAEIKTLEKETKHDVKAVEYFLRHQLEALNIPVDQYVHVALTSEDTNSLAQSLMIKEARDAVILPKLQTVLQQLATMIKQYQSTILLGRTHGQPAIPTTIGKEVLIFAIRLMKEMETLAALPIEAKLSGAIGNFSAQSVAFPKGKWLSLSQEFISSLGLEANSFTNQIVPAETYTRLFSSLVHINTILIDLNQDMWRYISDGYFIQQKTVGQVGSSTMPHKVNPIDFENSEGNLGLANALLTFFIQKLPISRLQRDLSDSTVKRSIGSAMGYSLLAYQSLLRGLGKVTVDEARLNQELDNHWEVVTEAFQVILRVNGDAQGYEKLKAFSQGKHITQSDITTFIDSLTVTPAIKDQLRAITPTTYIGLNTAIIKDGLKRINLYLQGAS